MSNELKYLQKPLSLEEIRAIADEDNYIEGLVWATIKYTHTKNFVIKNR